MSSINGIIDYTPEPEPEVHARQVRMLWLAAAVSLSMTAVGFIIMAFIIF
jgi:hypothetical protein